jgi:hypothetical protein
MNNEFLQPYPDAAVGSLLQAGSVAISAVPSLDERLSQKPNHNKHC